MTSKGGHRPSFITWYAAERERGCGFWVEKASPPAQRSRDSQRYSRAICRTDLDNIHRSIFSSLRGQNTYEMSVVQVTRDH